MTIYAQKEGSYTKQELLDLSTLLIKGGYTVRRGRMKVPSGKSADGSKYVEIIEFSGDASEDAETAAL